MLSGLLVGATLAQLALMAASVRLAMRGLWHHGADEELVIPAESAYGYRFLSMMETTRLLWSAELETMRGNPSAALEKNDRALLFARLSFHPWAYPSVLMHRSRLLLAFGYPDAALETNEEIMSAAERSNNRAMTAVAQAQRGLILALDGRYEEGIAYLEQSRMLAREPQSALLEQLIATLTEWTATTLLPSVYSMLGPGRGSSSAARELERMLDEHHLPFATTTAEAIRKLGSFQIWLGEKQKLRMDFAGIHRSLQRQGPQAAPGTLRQSAGGIPGASRCANGDQTLAVGLGQFHRTKAWRTGIWAPILYHLGDRTGAIRAWEIALAEELRVGDAQLAGIHLSGLSAALWLQGRFDEAIERAASAVACFEVAGDLNQRQESIQAYRGGVTRLFYHALLEMLSLELRTREAFAVAELAKARALLQALGNTRPVQQRSHASSFSRDLDQLAARIVVTERQMALAIGDERRAMESTLLQLRQLHEGLRARTVALDPELASVVKAHPVEAAQVQAALEPGVTLISFFVTDFRIHAWVIDRDTFSWFSLPPFEGEVSTPLCFSDAVRHSVRGSEPLAGCSTADQNAEGLYQQLIAPLRPHLHSSKLILIPHGVLHYVPFAALRDPATGRYLIEDFTLTYAPSASVLQYLRHKESPFTGRALVLGEPIPADPELPPLAGSRREAEEVAELLGTEPLLGMAASESALKELEGEVDIVHVAAHGLYFPRSAGFSRLALSPSRDGKDDGNLEVHEIYSELDLTGVNLVVLSACETALGEHSGGDEIVGLTRAFLYAGSPGVISTLWSVDDVASAELMTAFYRRLKAGAPVAEALRGAQLSLLAQERFAAPFYWAGYTLAGDPQARWIETKSHRASLRGSARDDHTPLE